MHFHIYLYYANTKYIIYNKIIKIFIHISKHLVSARIKIYNEILYSFEYACLRLTLYDHILFQIMLNKCYIQISESIERRKTTTFFIASQNLFEEKHLKKSNLLFRTL